MKRFLALLAAVCVCSGLSAQFRYQNPVIHADYSDPDVCRVGEEYWMTASSFNFFPGLPILHSRDLVHWELVGAALTEYPGEGWDAPEDDFRTMVQHGKAVWAPAIRSAASSWCGRRILPDPGRRLYGWSGRRDSSTHAPSGTRMESLICHMVALDPGRV